MRAVQRATGAPLDLSAGDGSAAPGPLERWKLPLTAVLLVATVLGAAWWLTRRPVEQPIVIPTPGGQAAREVKVHVTGAVARPGLYTFTRSARVDDAIQEAGGALSGADLSRVNLALPLKDGQQVVVPALPVPQPTAVPAATGSSPAVNAAPTPVGAPISASRAAKAPAPRPDARVNLNRATAAELEALPGIGAATAKRILEHRDKNGPFQTAEALRTTRLVPTRTWDQIKDLVTAP
jgi:competence protein ComEA